MLAYCQLSAVDLKARRQAEQTMVESEARLSDLVKTVNLGVFMVRDLGGTIRFWSEGCTRLFGWMSDEAVGQVSHNLLKTLFPVPLGDIEAMIESGGEWSGDVRQVTRDGRELVMAARLVLLLSSNAGAPVLLEALTDVTSQRHSEAALAELNRDLEKRVQDEVAAREAAQTSARHAQQMQALGQIAGGVAHEFNNMLQVIQGAAGLIETLAEDPASVKKFASLIQKSSDRGSVITGRLLAFARRSSFNITRIEPASMLAALGELMSHTLGGKILVRLDVQSGLRALRADASELETALINLATNARDAMPSGGTLTLVAAAETIEAESSCGVPLEIGHYVRLSVRDTGTGMDSDTMARAVEPFFTTKPLGIGTGLGLSMAKGFAEQSGGALTIESELGQGTTVTLWLPMPDDGVIAEAGELVWKSKAAAKRVRRVLLVDDDEMVLATLGPGLEHAGFSVRIVQSGDEALTLLGSEPADILVTDLSMPGMDGLTLIREVQKQLPHLPAIILTGDLARVRSSAIADAFNGTVSVLRKPITVSCLVKRLKSKLRPIVN